MPAPSVRLQGSRAVRMGTITDWLCKDRPVRARGKASSLTLLRFDPMTLALLLSPPTMMVGCYWNTSATARPVPARLTSLCLQGLRGVHFLLAACAATCSASWAERAWPRAICATGRSWRSGSTSSTSSRNCVLGAKPTTATVNSPACSSPLRAQPAARLCLWCRTSFHRMCARALPPNSQPRRLAQPPAWHKLVCARPAETVSGQTAHRSSLPGCHCGQTAYSATSAVGFVCRAHARSHCALALLQPIQGQGNTNQVDAISCSIHARASRRTG